MSPIMRPTTTEPELVEAFGVFNIVSWQNRIHGIPQSLGPRDLTKIDPASLEGVCTGTTIEDVKAQIIDRYRSEWAHTWGQRDFIEENSELDRLDLPEVVEIEPIHTCNFRCVMCHVPYEKELYDLPVLRISLNNDKKATKRRQAYGLPEIDRLLFFSRPFSEADDLSVQS